MKLKDATIIVLICLGISLSWTLASFLLPRSNIEWFYRFKLGILLYMARDISLMIFFVVLLQNQRS